MGDYRPKRVFYVISDLSNRAEYWRTIRNRAWSIKARKATARVPSPPHNRPRLYYDYGNGFTGAFIVEAGEGWMMGGDPCGRLPRTHKYIEAIIYMGEYLSRTHKYAEGIIYIWGCLTNVW